MTAIINKIEVSAALAKNSSLTPQEVNQAVNNFLIQQDKFFNDLEANIQSAKLKYAELKDQAREKAANATKAAAKAAAKAALWSFIGLLIGLNVTIFAGRFGVNHSNNRSRYLA